MTFAAFFGLTVFSLLFESIEKYPFLRLYSSHRGDFPVQWEGEDQVLWALVVIPLI